MSGRYCPHCCRWLPRKKVPKDWREELDAMVHSRPELGIIDDLAGLSVDDALRLYLALLKRKV